MTILRGKIPLRVSFSGGGTDVDPFCEKYGSTVLTSTNAKIIDVIHVIEVGENLAIVGYGPYKDTVLKHLQPRILQQDVSIRDISMLNDVYLSTEPIDSAQNVTISQSYLGWLIVS